MKLPASVLAALCLSGVTGCETRVDFERRNTPPAPRAPIAEKGEVEHVQVEMPAAAPIAKPTPRPIKVPTKLVPAPKPQTHVCGPCGMG